MLEHLFERNVEGTMGERELRSEFRELKQLYDESVRNTNALEAEIAGMKGEHETEKVGDGTCTLQCRVCTVWSSLSSPQALTWDWDCSPKIFQSLSPFQSQSLSVLRWFQH